MVSATVTVAKTVSRVVTHMAIAFVIAWAMTGSVALGGVAALLEPLVNVALLPLHERGWGGLHRLVAAARARATLVALEKISQTALHVVVAVGVMYWATGSLALGGLAALIEPVFNVIVLPFHDRLWERLRPRFERLVAEIREKKRERKRAPGGQTLVA